MSQKIQTFRPRYELHHCTEESVYDEFVFNDIRYRLMNRMFERMTATQKEVLNWLLRMHRRSAPPMSISHGKPTAPDQNIFYNEETYHISHSPYAMVEVTVHFAGENEPKLLKVYFCNTDAFNPDTRTLHRGTSVRISFS